jgi:DNA repair protein RecO (recombination protein O)
MRAIILSKTKYGESDLILKLLDSDGYLFSAIAKSALKSKKRFSGGVLEPTHHVDLRLLERKGGEDRMQVIGEAKIVHDFHGIRTSYNKLTMGIEFCMTVGRMIREGVPHPEVFNLLGHALATLEDLGDKEIEKLRVQFELKLMHSQGILDVTAEMRQFLNRPIRETGDIDTNGDELERLRKSIKSVLPEYTGF